MSRIKHLVIPILVGLCIMSCVELQKAVTDASKISDPSKIKTGPEVYRNEDAFAMPKEGRSDVGLSLILDGF